MISMICDFKTIYWEKPNLLSPQPIFKSRFKFIQNKINSLLFFGMPIIWTKGAKNWARILEKVEKDIPMLCRAQRKGYKRLYAIEISNSEK